jgi:hypothetical protein
MPAAYLRSDLEEKGSVFPIVFATVDHRTLADIDKVFSPERP